VVSAAARAGVSNAGNLVNAGVFAAGVASNVAQGGLDVAGKIAGLAAQAARPAASAAGAAINGVANVAETVATVASPIAGRIASVVEDRAAHLIEAGSAASGLLIEQGASAAGYVAPMIAAGATQIIGEGSRLVGSAALPLLEYGKNGASHLLVEGVNVARDAARIAAQLELPHYIEAGAEVVQNNAARLLVQSTRAAADSLPAIGESVARYASNGAILIADSATAVLSRHDELAPVSER